MTLPDAPDATGGGALIHLEVGDAAPAFSTTALTGQPVRLRDLMGKTLLLDFWATWCGPCVADLPHLIDVQKKFAARKDFVIIGVSLDFDEKTLRKFLTKRKIDWLQVFGDDAQSMANDYGVEGIPAVFLISPEGKIVGADLRGEQFVKVVEEALSTSDPK
ncbi:MAG: TlpA family protein disulfide reductase [Planctomycetes bacterium]|nr:TlpA family protein disulfide reductase [Planctomycetota bacterium]